MFEACLGSVLVRQYPHAIVCKESKHSGLKKIPTLQQDNKYSKIVNQNRSREEDASTETQPGLQGVKTHT